MTTFRGPVTRAARSFRDRIALVDASTNASLTFGQLLAESERIGGFLLDLDLEPGAVLAILADGSPLYAGLYLAAPAHGFVVAPLNTRYTASELVAALEDSAAAVLFTDRDLDPLVADAVDLVVRLGTSFDAALATARRVELPRGAEDDVAVIFYTGGTTDRAKGVALSHRNKLSDALSLIQAVDLSPDDRWLVMSPMFHAAGSFNVLPCVWIGTMQVFLPRFDAETVLRAIQEHRITITFGVPTMLQALVDAQKRLRADVSSLRLLGHGGAPISPVLAQRTAATFPGVELCAMYGATEMAPLATVLRHQEVALGRPAGRSTGIAVLGVEVDVLDSDGIAAPAGEIGEIVVTGPNVMVGYWNKREATRKVLDGRSYRSGDLGYLDDEGRLYVVDRSKDMIISGGENVYSVEVEDVLVEHPDVIEAAVLGVPDPQWGEVVIAIVVTCADIEASVLDAHCRTSLANYKVPRRYEFRTEALPRSAAGKLLKRLLRDEIDSPV